MPVLETRRLRIRELTPADLEAVHQLLDIDLAGGDAHSLEQRRRWLDWTVLSYAQLAELHQPPYGDRALEARLDGELVGVCGFVPCLGPFRGAERYAAEVGVY
jgi:RimJ/RimL family protein N-acetyltransferase